MNQLWAVVAALLPSIGVGYLFYRIIKAIVEGDRNERRAQAQWEAEQERSPSQDASATSMDRKSARGRAENGHDVDTTE